MDLAVAFWTWRLGSKLMLPLVCSLGGCAAEDVADEKSPPSNRPIDCWMGFLLLLPLEEMLLMTLLGGGWLELLVQKASAALQLASSCGWAPASGALPHRSEGGAIE